MGLTLQDGVAEVSVLKGNNQTLRCEVTPEEHIHLIVWKKIENDAEDIVTYNNVTTDADRYEVVPPDGMLLIHVRVEDEGLYQCEMGGVAARTRVNVLEAVSNLTISTNGADITGSGPFNITCHAQHARPPATLRWYWGTRDITMEASTYNSVYHADGYGDSESVLYVPDDWYGEEVVFRCVASVGDPAADETAFLFVPHLGAASHMFLTPAVLICTLMVNLLITCRLV
ncbi:hypothetical protein BaRGS_00026509 [Batillaria attramentaria]|uniref:Ig-like domain-containing protein n=1 Tax=Batillaria attramentaria TaxID=370345 RepID=A0ABD0K620_9CAEN